MDREIKRKIKELCDDAGSAAAAAACDDLTDNIEKAYNERVKAGMSELDAYRDVLKNIDDIKKMLDSMPLTEDEKRGRSTRDDYKQNAKFIDKICSALWMLVVFVYLAFSLIFGGWRVTWLIFIWGSIGQSIMNMVKKYNKGTPLNTLLKHEVPSIVWRVIVILYFGISLTVGGWKFTWLLFILGVLINKVFDLLFGDNAEG
jgi:uncharacterized membrane protein